MTAMLVTKPPYYAVIFSSRGINLDEAYEQMAQKMLELAARQAGFLGVESARSEIGITVSYWRDMKSIQAWKQHMDHIQAQHLGREKWYQCYRVRIARVEIEYGFSHEDQGNRQWPFTDDTK